MIGDNDSPHGRARRAFLGAAICILAVFLFAFALRWPSCGESFWVDELHTAWCVFGPFDEVAHRAKIGNQQSGYFYALWAWGRLLPDRVVSVYGIESLLRLASVTLVSISAAWLVLIVRRASGSLFGGIAAGIALAVEGNAIFFGTELRPYAGVIFGTTVILWIGGKNLGLAKSMSLRRSVALHTVAMLAVATHVTAVVILAPLLIAIIGNDCWSRFRAISQTPKPGATTASRLTASLLPMIVASVAWLGLAVGWCNTHAGVWQSRNAWSSFAVARSWADVWQLWPWASLVIIPCVMMLLVCRRKPNRSDSLATVSVVHYQIGLFVMVLATATLGCYLLSTLGGVPLWHRRYLVGSLPILCVVFGLAFGAIDTALKAATDWKFTKGKSAKTKNAILIGLASTCLLVMTVQQRTLQRIARGQWQLVHRGEDWRSAITFARRNASPGDLVWIDAGLIEQDGQPLLVSDPKLEEYLRYVTSGPYRFGGDAQPIGCGADALKVWRNLPGSNADSTTTTTTATATATATATGRMPSILITRRVGVDGCWGRAFSGVTVLIRRE